MRLGMMDRKTEGTLPMHYRVLQIMKEMSFFGCVENFDPHLPKVYFM